jgi:hypothetical protein
MSWPSLVCIAAGCVWLSWLLHVIPDNETFFSADGGAKTLILKSLLREPASVLPSPQASLHTLALWAAGYDPFAALTVNLRGETFSAFPVPFAILSAPFYELFGSRGLYLLPVIGVLGTWVIVGVLLQRSRSQTWVRLVVMATLIFGTHLAFYGAAFWEHGPATALVACGLVGALALDNSPRRDIVCGLLLGLAAWLRPEAGLIGLCLVVMRVWTFGVRQSFWFATGAGLGAGSYLIWNLALYGVLEGAHGIQTTGQYANSGTATVAGARALELAGLGVMHSPTLWLAVPLVLLSCDVRNSGLERARLPLLAAQVVALSLIWMTSGLHHPAAMIGTLLSTASLIAYCLVSRIRPEPRETVLLGALILFGVGLPFIAPNTGGYQMGPRYLLVGIPLAAILLALGLERFRARAARWE